MGRFQSTCFKCTNVNIQPRNQRAVKHLSSLLLSVPLSHIEIWIHQAALYLCENLWKNKKRKLSKLDSPPSLVGRNQFSLLNIKANIDLTDFSPEFLFVILHAIAILKPQGPYFCQEYFPHLLGVCFKRSAMSKSSLNQFTHFLHDARGAIVFLTFYYTYYIRCSRHCSMANVYVTLAKEGRRESVEPGKKNSTCIK